MALQSPAPVGSGQSSRGHSSGPSGNGIQFASLKATSIGVGLERNPVFVPFSDRLPDDPFSMLGLYDRGQKREAGTYALPAPVALDDLAELFGASCILPQCADAVAVNVEGQGYDLVPVRKVKPDTPAEIRKAMAVEKRRLRQFLRSACGPLSWRETWTRARLDKESTGWRGVQVLRLPPKDWQAMKPASELSATELAERERAWATVDPLGEITGLEHIESNTLRWCQASEPILTTDWVYEEDEEPDLDEDPSTPRYVPQRAWRRFRLLAHARSGAFSRLKSKSLGVSAVEPATGLTGWNVVYFREFGDPRIIDSRDGRVIGNYLTGEFPDQTELDPETREPKYAPRWWANELIIDKTYFSLWQPYGRPWWFGVAETDMGLTSAAEANRHGIEDPTIPRVIIGAEGTDTAYGDIERLDDKARKERSGDTGAHFRMMLFETKPTVIGDELSGEAKGVRPGLTVHQISNLPDDGLFVEFDEQGRKKVRSARGLSSMSVGLSEDFSFASAQASMQVENQRVFDPEREAFEDLINGTILTSLRALWWRYQSRRTRIIAPEERTRAIEVAEEGGALTPNKHRELLSDTLGTEIEPISEDWGDRPFAVVLAESQAANSGFGLGNGGGGGGEQGGPGGASGAAEGGAAKPERPQRPATDEGDTPGDSEGAGAEKRATKAAGQDISDADLTALLQGLRHRLARKAGLLP